MSSREELKLKNKMNLPLPKLAGERVSHQPPCGGGMGEEEHGGGGGHHGEFDANAFLEARLAPHDSLGT